MKATLCCICWLALDFGFLLSLLIFQVEHLSFNDLQGLDNSYSRVLKKNLSLHFCWQSISIIVSLFGGTRLELKQLPGKFLFGKKKIENLFHTRDNDKLSPLSGRAWFNLCI